MLNVNFLLEWKLQAGKMYAATFSCFHKGWETPTIFTMTLFFLCQMLTSCLCIIFTLLYPESPQRSGCCWVIDRHKQAEYLGLGKETLISTPAEWDRGMRFCGEDFIELKKVDSWQMIFFRSSNSPHILSGILRQYDWSVIEKANNPVRAVALSRGTVQPPQGERWVIPRGKWEGKPRQNEKGDGKVLSPSPHP